MNLTLKDFRNMVKTAPAEAGLDSRAGVLRTIGQVYGYGLIQAMYKQSFRVLTNEGVDEFNTVKSWIAGGAKGKLKPTHSCEHLHGLKTGRRKISLYETKRGGGGPRAKIDKHERQALLAKARAVAPLPMPTAMTLQKEMVDIQKNGVIVFYKRILENVGGRDDVSGEAKSLIAEALNVAGVSLAELSLAGR